MKRPVIAGSIQHQFATLDKHVKRIMLGIMMMESYSLGDLVNITGAKRRSIQLWADAGVIQAERGTERAGTGTHRRFSRREAIVACVIHPFAERQISIGELLSISAIIRASLLTTPEQFELAIAGGHETIFAYEGRLMRGKANWPADAPEWSYTYTIGQRETFAKRDTTWPDVVMAIRLETYLSKLQ
ncbi:hypothetical protein [Bradyrhizobium icense]|uniref:hypothetical protein n=1 Tax=Bradyrhizobium icense TaxID=1274631 RepID=UPI0012EA6B2B|nr:hypothetical protein [Bradyrhizobium icense]